MADLYKHTAQAVLIAILVFLSAPLRAVDTTWTFDGDGNWNEAAKWSNGVPIDETYNVFIDDGDSAVTVTLNESRSIGGLTLGDDDTLLLQNTGTELLSLTSVNGFTNDGSIFLTGMDSGGTALSLGAGTLVNAETGVLQFQSGGTGSRFFTGDLSNLGTVLIDRPTTFDKEGGNYTNEGQFTVNSFLTISNGAAYEQNGGTLQLGGGSGILGIFDGSSLTLNDGAIEVLGILGLDGTVFTQNGGTLQAYSEYSDSGILTNNGTYQFLGGTVIGDLTVRGNLVIGPAATSSVSFVLMGPMSISLSESGLLLGQTLTLLGDTPVNPAVVTSATGFENNGMIRFGSSTLHQSAVLHVGELGITNTATGHILFQSPVSTGVYEYYGNLDNYGNVTVSAWEARFMKAGASYVNRGQITIDSNKHFSVYGGEVFEQTAGQLDIKGMFLLSATPFVQSGGVVNVDGTLSLINGNSITLRNGATFNVNGSIALAAGSGITFEENAVLSINSSLNIGNAVWMLESGGELNLNGSLTMTSGGVITQSGATLDFGASSVIHGGRVNLNDGPITGALTVNGTYLKLATDYHLNVVFQGMSTLELPSGTLRASQIVTLKRISGSTPIVTSASGFINEGSILLASTDLNHPRLRITNGTLVNAATGLLHFQAGGTGTRQFNGCDSPGLSDSGGA